MIRRSFAVVLITASLIGSSAHAEGRDIIVVEPSTEQAAEAANTNADQALAVENRGLLTRMVAFGCTRKARTSPEVIALSERHGGKDIAAPYCQCMAGGMVDRLTAEHIKTIIRTRKPDPALQQEMMPVAQACMEHAIAAR